MTACARAQVKFLGFVFFFYYRNPTYTSGINQRSLKVWFCFSFSSSLNNSVDPVEDWAALGFPLSSEEGAG